MEFYEGDSTCMECRKKIVIEHRLANIERVRAYDRQRGLLPHRKAAVKARAVSRDSRAEATTSYRQRHSAKYAAVNAVNNAIRDGRLVHCPCEWCGFFYAQAHHFDYTKPLDVTWFCETCHATVHRIDRERKRRAGVFDVEPVRVSGMR